jgi:hypothetical protein
MAERFNPTHKRTIGIITHRDTPQQNSEAQNTFIELLKKEKAQLKLS